MGQSARKRQLSEIELRQGLNGLERDWLLCRLLALDGVRDAAYRVSNPRRLIVEHDAAVVTAEALIALLRQSGLTCAIRLVEPQAPARKCA